MIKVLLADDHELIRTGIRRLLNDAPGIQVEAEADCGEAAVEIVRQQQPDVVLMDLGMPGIGGFEATRKIIQMGARTKVIILTVQTDELFPCRLLEAGAMGYLTKGCSVDEMVRAIERVHSGERYVSPDIAQNIALSKVSGGSLLSKLSQRETQVLYMLIQGGRLQDISDKLHISPKTVSTYRYRLYDKLDVRSDAELARVAMRHGLLDGLP